VRQALQSGQLLVYEHFPPRGVALDGGFSQREKRHLSAKNTVVTRRFPVILTAPRFRTGQNGLGFE
jgi:hypothetical protein